MPIDFWFEFASTYSYPAAMRIERLASAQGLTVNWKPFLLGPIFKSQGWNDSPFNIFPDKGRYMWRDLERICAALDLPFRRPSAFPRNGLLAARVAYAHGDAAWLPTFVRAVYRANFADDRDIAATETIADCLALSGQDAQACLSRASSPATKEGLRTQSEQAMRLGLFGAPSFIVGRELYWGHDRLEQAIAWCVQGGQVTNG